MFKNKLFAVLVVFVVLALSGCTTPTEPPDLVDTQPMPPAQTAGMPMVLRLMDDVGQFIGVELTVTELRPATGTELIAAAVCSGEPCFQISGTSRGYTLDPGCTSSGFRRECIVSGAFRNQKGQTQPFSLNVGVLIDNDPGGSFGNHWFRFMEFQPGDTIDLVIWATASNAADHSFGNRVGSTVLQRIAVLK